MHINNNWGQHKHTLLSLIIFPAVQWENYWDMMIQNWQLQLTWQPEQLEWIQTS